MLLSKLARIFQGIVLGKSASVSGNITKTHSTYVDVGMMSVLEVRA